jgi:hypothetical protein
MLDWILLGCAAVAAALSTYVFLGRYHWEWANRDRGGDDG